MKEKSSFTTEKPIDYTQTKDAYEGMRESAVSQDSTPYPALQAKADTEAKS